jgi:hypothetical protein
MACCSSTRFEGTIQWNSSISEIVRNRTHVHIVYTFLLRMTDTMTSQNNDFSSWDTLYVGQVNTIVKYVAIIRQRLCKHVPTRKQPKIQEKCFLCGPRRDCLLGKWVVTRLYNNRESDIFCAAQSVPRLYKEDRHLPLKRVLPCGGGIEYLHRNPTCRKRRRKGKSRIWDSKIWSRVPWEKDLKMTALSRTRSNCKRQTRPLDRKNAPYQQTRNCLTVLKIWS